MTPETIEFTLLGIGAFISLWSSIANYITGNKRQFLIDHWKYSGSQPRIHDEFDRVTYNQHFWRVFTFRSAKYLYGPLTQHIWDHTGNNVNTYDQFWWRCYTEIYLKLDADGKRERLVRYYMSRRPYGATLYYALEYAGIDVKNIWFELTEQKNAETISPMIEGAEEYEEIMAAREIMEPQ